MIKKILRTALSRNGNLSTFLWRRKAASAGLELWSDGRCIELRQQPKVLRLRRSHAIYVPHMIESFDYYWNSVFPEKEGDLQVVDMSGPKLHRLVGFAHTPLLFPSHTEPYSTTAEYLEFANLKPGHTVLDIGAYAGVTSIVFAKLVAPGGRVYSFEADGGNYRCALENIKTAAESLELRNISLSPKAVWSHSNGLAFSNEDSMGSSAVSITGGGRGKEQTAASTTIEEICKEHELKHVDFVKIDIEGGETELLKCSARSLRDLGARLIVEPHRVRGKLNTEQCCQLLAEGGFSVRVRDKSPGSEALIEAY